VVFAHQPHDRFSAAGPLQTSRSIEVEKRAADVIAIVALLSSYCLVVHLESEQFFKKCHGLRITRSKVSFINCFLVYNLPSFHHFSSTDGFSETFPPSPIKKRPVPATRHWPPLHPVPPGWWPGSSPTHGLRWREVLMGALMGNNGDGWENGG
jgi:hypothetical protein